MKLPRLNLFKLSPSPCSATVRCLVLYRRYVEQKLSLWHLTGKVFSLLEQAFEFCKPRCGVVSVPGLYLHSVVKVDHRMNAEPFAKVFR